MNYAKSTIVDFYVFGGRIVFTVFLYVASIVIPLLLLVAVFGFGGSVINSKRRSSCLMTSVSGSVGVGLKAKLLMQNMKL